MSSDSAPIKTLVFQLSAESENEQLLYHACTEARRVYNEAIWLAKVGIDRDDIATRLADEVDLVKRLSYPSPRSSVTTTSPSSTTTLMSVLAS